jgi:hypothetical protein
MKGEPIPAHIKDKEERRRHLASLPGRSPWETIQLSQLNHELREYYEENPFRIRVHVVFTLEGNQVERTETVTAPSTSDGALLVRNILEMTYGETPGFAILRSKAWVEPLQL